MSKYTAEQILQSVEEQNVRFVRLQFSDVFGILKNVSIPISQLKKALDGKIMFDGSSVEGFARIEESDMSLKPDFNTWQVLPEEYPEGKIAHLICDVYNDKDEPFEGDPRYILRKNLAAAEEMGFTLNIGPEAEFFLFRTDENGAPTLETNDKAGYFDISPVDQGSTARREIVDTLEIWVTKWKHPITNALPVSTRSISNTMKLLPPPTASRPLNWWFAPWHSVMTSTRPLCRNRSTALPAAGCI